MKRLFLLVALFMLLVPAFATKVAILIGCNAYLNFSPLKCCVADVNTMRDALKAAGYQVYTMTGKEVDVKGEPIYAFAPLKKNIDHQLDVWVPEKAYGAGDTLLFFFSGHGIRSLDGLDYLAPLDGQFKGDAVDFTSLVPMHTLYEQLRRSGAENLFIITDACRNEPGRGVVKSGGFGQGAARDLTELKVNDQQHVMLLRSCTEEQRSYEMPDGAGGYFTHAFSLGLAGAAAQDGAVTAAGLCEFVKEQVRKEVAAAENLPQVPQFTFTNADPTTIILAEKPAELHFSLTTPAALARGEELLLDSDSVIVEGVVDDAPGVALSVDGEREVTLRAASKDLVTKITRRPFTVTLTGFRPGNSYRKVLTLHDAAGHRTQVTLRLRYPGTALGNLHVTTDPPGAQVMVGGGTVDGVTPLTVKGLPAGDITVLVTRDGFGDVTQTVKILPGQEAPLVVKLPLLQGAIVVKSNPPGATVFIDNVERGVTIMEGLKVIAIPIGTHTIKLTLPDYREETCQELVTNHGNKEVSVPLTGLPGKVTITTTPKGATVTLDGQERGKSLLSLTDMTT